MRVLVVEDDPILSDGLSVGLTMAGFSPDAVACIADAETAMRGSAYEAVVLDVMLPDGSGIDYLARRREAGDRTPVLILTARDRVPERIEGLNAGADDYLGKPFDLDELAARLRALVRRNAGRAASTLTWFDVVLDPATRAVSRAGRAIPLTRREFTILRALMERPGTIFTKPALEEAIYGWQEGVESNAVEVHVHHLRSKIGSGVVQTVRGLGYRTAQRRMIERTRERLGLWPERLVADGGYGDAANFAWLVEEQGIEPHIPVCDKSARRDGTFERADFVFAHSYVCPAGNRLRPRNRNFAQPRSLANADGSIRYRASHQDCSNRALKPRCTPNMPARKVTRSIHEGARDMAGNIATTDAYVTSRRQRKKVEMLFAHLKRILGLSRLRLRGPNGAKDEFHLAATAQNLRKMAKLIPLTSRTAAA